MGRGLGNGSPALGSDRRGVSARPRTRPKAGPTPLSHTSSPASLPTRPLPNRTKLRSQEPSHAAGETHKRRENGGQVPTEIAEGAGAHGAARGSGGGGKSRARRRRAAGGERRGAGTRGSGRSRRRLLRAAARVRPSALRSQRCGPGPAAVQRGVLRFFCTFLSEVRCPPRALWVRHRPTLHTHCLRPRERGHWTAGLPPGSLHFSLQIRLQVGSPLDLGGPRKNYFIAFFSMPSFICRPLHPLKKQTTLYPVNQDPA